MKCSICNKEFGFFTWKYECKSCGNFVCHSCTITLTKFDALCVDPFNTQRPSDNFWTGNWSCLTCYDAYFKAICQRYLIAIKENSRIEVFPDTYKGKVALPNDDSILIRTTFYRNRDDVEYRLRVTAAFLGKNRVVTVKWKKKTESEPGTSNKGKHFFTTWSASGLAT